MRNISEPIAIIGIGCRFPGGANSAAEFWQLLLEGRDAVTEIGEDRWSIARHFHPEQGIAGKTYSKWAGQLDNISDFEPERFGISPREAQHVDPQQRLLLECSWQALEDAGLPASAISGSDTGVFVGISTSDYSELQQSTSVDQSGVSAHTATGGVASIAANRISYCFDLHGPSLAVDTACSSSLVAADVACQSLWNGESQMALVGGVNLILSPAPFIAFCAASMLSPDGRCKAFDASGNGFVRAEGAGVVILKPLSKAEADGDRIYALIRATGCNQDGRTTGIVMPSSESQQALLEHVYNDAGIRGEDVYYIEAHGTGTAIGDPLETAALGNAFRKRPTQDSGELLIGSVKSNIGHLEAGAGMAGLIKTVLSLHHREIPANLHFNTPNPKINFEQLQLKVVDRNTTIPDHVEPLIMGVNSFGFGGANAHVALQNYADSAAPAECVALEADSPDLLVMSSSGEEALPELAARYQKWLEHNPDINLRSACRAAATQRSHLDYRLAIAFSNRDDLLDSLKACQAGERRPAMVQAHCPHQQAPRVVFVFSGQGPQWWAMGRELFERNELFRSVINECDAVVRSLGEWSLKKELLATEAESRMADTAISQPALFALQTGIARILLEFGIEPMAVIGHSVGEVAAAHISGALSLEDAMRVIYHRGRTMATAPGGRMLALGLSPEQAEELIKPYEGAVVVGACNAPNSVTLSGDAEALADLAAQFEDGNVFCRFLKVNYAFHSHHMDPVKDELMVSLDGLQSHMPNIDMVSSVSGELIYEHELEADYWWRNVRQPVRFSESLKPLIAAGADVFVEISPHPVLANSIRQTLQAQGANGHVLPTLKRETPERRQILSTVGELHTVGYPIEWSRLWPEQVTRMDLPKTPWQKKRYWHEPAVSEDFRHGESIHPWLQRPVDAPERTWETAISTRMFSFLIDHRVQDLCVFPAAGYVETALAAGRIIDGDEKVVIEDLQFEKALILPEAGENQLLRFSWGELDRHFRIASRSVAPGHDWEINAAGFIRKAGNTTIPPTFNKALLHPTTHKLIDHRECYGGFTSVGLKYGAAFSGVRWIENHGDCLVGEVAMAETLNEDGSLPFWFHPALLDSCFQVLRGATEDVNGRLYLPVRIDRLRSWSVPEQVLTVQVVPRRIDDKSLYADLNIFNSDGSAVLSIEGFQCRAIAAASGVESQRIEDWLYHTDWTLVSSAPHQALDYIDQVFLQKTEIERITGEMSTFHAKRVEDSNRASDLLVANHVARALSDLGIDLTQGRTFSWAQVKTLMGNNSAQLRYARCLCDHLEQRGFLEARDPDTWLVKSPLPTEPLAAFRDAVQRFPDDYAQNNLIHLVGRRLAEILAGRTPALDVLFGDAGHALLSELYHDSVSFRYHNEIIARSLSAAIKELPPGHTVRILEIGAGTGGLTRNVLPVLPPEQTEYVFTDISPFFMETAENLAKDCPFVRHQVFDITRPLAEQSIEPGSFDIVLASDVLHATPDLGITLANIKQLLAPGGLLMFLEVEARYMWIDAVFGLTEGWWAHTDTIRRNHPLLSRDQWVELLENSGFNGVVSMSPGADPVPHGQIVVAARASLEPDQQSVPTAAGPGGSKPLEASWLLFCDDAGYADLLIPVLAKRGVDITQVKHGELNLEDSSELSINRDSETDHRALFDHLSKQSGQFERILDCSALHQDDGDIAALPASSLGCCTRLTHLVQALTVHGGDSLPALWVITRGAQTVDRCEPANPDHTALTALGRVIGNETVGLTCRFVDLPAQKLPDPDLVLDHLLQSSEDDETAIRHGAVYSPRLDRSRNPRKRIDLTQQRNPDMRYRLFCGDNATLEGLSFRQIPYTPLAEDMVEVEVSAAALNFRDVLKALNLYPTDGGDAGLLGDEFSGVISRIGENITHLEPGQRVFGIAPACFASHVVTRADAVMPVPDGVSEEQAACIPITFLTAWYALHHLGRIEAGESILIQAGAGGVGLAALQIALKAGATVYATAGTEEKRQLLYSLGATQVMNSRNLDFADEIMNATKGRGVDLVLNSLAGEAIAKGIECLAPCGRFLELGKRDIYENRSLSLWAFRRNLSFYGIDLSRLMVEKPGLVQKIMTQVNSELGSGDFLPPPHRVFPAVRTRDAFRYMAKGQHVGKVLVSMRSGSLDVVKLPPVRFELQGGNGCFLVTGGTSGFGFEIAKWLVQQGARSLALASRSGSVNETNQAIIDSWRDQGIEVKVAAVDVADRISVDGLVKDLESGDAALKGIFHGAMVIDDGLFLQMTTERFERVMKPKVNGCVNLHLATSHLDLNYFVMFSSASTIVGNPGQSNYVAANAFLDGFAHYRRSRGQAALSVNWGRISEVGYVARNDEVANSLDKRGFLGIDPERAMLALERLLMANPAQAAAMRMDWQNLSSLPRQTRYYERLAIEQNKGSGSDQRGVMRQQIQELPPEQRYGATLDYITEQASLVLGTSASKLSPDEMLNGIGLDSLMAVELINQVERELDVSIPTAKVIQEPTIRRLTLMALEQMDLEFTSDSSGEDQHSSAA